MTKSEQEQIIRVCGKDYEETDIPSYIKNREARNWETLMNLYQKNKPQDIKDWAELHGAVQNEEGEWEV